MSHKSYKDLYRLVCLLALLVSVVTGCQTNQPKPPAEPAAEQVRIGWTNLVSLEWKFSVRLPCTPTFESSELSNPKLGKVPVVHWLSAFDGVAGSIVCDVTCAQYPLGPNLDWQKLALSMARTNAVGQGKLISDTAVEHNGLKYQEWTMEKEGGKFLIVARTFFVGNYSYTLVSLIDRQYFDEPAEIREAALNTRKRFFDSFEILK